MVSQVRAAEKTPVWQPWMEIKFSPTKPVQPKQETGLAAFVVPPSKKRKMPKSVGDSMPQYPTK